MSDDDLAHEYSRLEHLYPEDPTARVEVEYIPPLTLLLWFVYLTRDPNGGGGGDSIVLVPGLGGHYIKTWEASDKTVWPRDLLFKIFPDIREDIPKIRVLSFNITPRSGAQ